MKRWILLTPGPVNVSDDIKASLSQPDLCHREPEFSEILANVRQKLNRVFRGDQRYTAIVVGGSGTASLESVISSVVRRGKLLVLSNGYYGEKLQGIARIHGIPTVHHKLRWGQPIRTSDVRAILAKDGRIEYVCMIHNETSVGMLNDVGSIGNLVSDFGKIFMVDAISSLGAENLDVKSDKIDFCVGTSNKCIESIPGLSFVCAKKSHLEELKDQSPRTSYLDLYGHYVFEEGFGERLGTPFTPPVQSFYALDKALDLLLKEGVEKRTKRYAMRARRVQRRLEELGFRLLLAPKYRCHSITSIITPTNVSYKTLHDQLKRKGFIIYPGQGPLEGKTFRIGNMGAITKRDFDEFLSSVDLTLKKLKTKPQYS